MFPKPWKKKTKPTHFMVLNVHNACAIIDLGRYECFEMIFHLSFLGDKEVLNGEELIRFKWKRLEALVELVQWACKLAP